MRKKEDKTERITLSDATQGSLLALWSVAKGGYRITSELKYVGGAESGQRTDPPFLVPNSPDEVRVVYPVLGNKLLHRDFAEVDIEDSILKFANRYGLLGRSLFLAPQGGGTVVIGESLSEWKAKIEKFGILLTIWDLVKKRAAGKLGQIVIWPRPDHVAISFYWLRSKDDYGFYIGKNYRDFKDFQSQSKESKNCGFESRILADKNIHPELLNRWRSYDSIEPALYYVCDEVNKNLDSQFSFKILPFVHKEIYTQPKTLEGTMWLMFAYDINGRVNPVQCAYCHQWFDRNHATRRHCSDTCKSKASYHKRKKEKEAQYERSYPQTG